MDIGAYILVVVVSYLLGATPSGYLAGMACGVDVRSSGSGNIGATNVLRVLGKKAGAIVLAADALKGFVSARWVPLLALHVFPAPGASRENLAVAAGVAAILGHIYTCWLKFKGGKGIATTGGVVLAWAPFACLTALALWGLVLAASKYVSLASIAAAVVLPFAVWFEKRGPTLTVVMTGLSLLAIYKHKANIQRLLKGAESRIGEKKDMNVTVIGAGAWGSALANLLCQNDHAVTLWGHDATHLAQMRQTLDNPPYLPGIPLSPTITFQEKPAEAIKNAECVVLAVPSKFFRGVTRQFSAFEGLAVSVTKGIEYETGLTMSALLKSTMPKAAAAALSGPTLALEVARGIPAAIVAAHPQLETARRVQALFGRPAFRVYTSQDVTGVELGGAIKNVVALAAGIGDGLGFGDNAKAGLVTRGLAEMRRLGVARGAHAETFSGLSGLGDLAVTCYSRLSRNRAFGERVGRGEKVESILAAASSVAEGYPTARSAFQLARALGVESPIIDEVHAMLYQGKNIRRAVHDLMSREPKPED